MWNYAVESSAYNAYYCIKHNKFIFIKAFYCPSVNTPTALNDQKPASTAELNATGILKLQNKR